MIETLISLGDHSPAIRFGVLLITIAVIVMISTGNLLPDFAKRSLGETETSEPKTHSKEYSSKLYENTNRVIFIGGWILILVGLLAIFIGLLNGAFK